MNKPAELFLKLSTYPFKIWYMFSELWLAYFCNKRTLKILFTIKPVWKTQLNRVFRFLPHTLAFAEFNPQTVTEYDLVIPLFIEDVFHLNTIRHLLKNDNLIPIPSTECANVCNDKYLFSQTLIAMGFGDYVPHIDNHLSYPFFLKKKIDIGAVHTYLIENREQKHALLSTINHDEYYRQECIFGTREYATTIFFKNNRIIRSITLEDIFEHNDLIKGKDKSIGSKMHEHCPYLDLFADILSSIGYEGICCFNYKVMNNRPLIFEINPHCDGEFSLYFFSFLRSLD